MHMTDAPLILACDTTQGACSAAVFQDRLLAYHLEPMRQGHAEALMPMLADIMEEAGLAMPQIDRLAVTHGPGTFTGVRVGISAMRGLALALDRPLKTFGTLEVMARGAPTDNPLIVAVDARRETFYAQAFGVDKSPLGPPQALTASGVAALIEPQAATGSVGIIGSGAAVLAETDPRLQPLAAADYPQAAHLAEMAAQDAGQKGAWSDLPPAEPLYLRPPDATLPDRAKYPARQS